MTVETQEKSNPCLAASCNYRTAACYFVLLFIGLVSYIPWLGSFSPLDPTDSFFLESARELIETGNYLLPLTNYEPWLDKPILYFWLVTLSYKIGGISPFVGRLPSALSAIALSLTVFAATRTLIRTRTAFLAAVFFLCCPLSSVVGHVCLTDMTLSLCISACILFLYRGLRCRTKKDLFIGYLALGLGLLCKGPIAGILCGLSLGLYIILKNRSRQGTWQDIKALHPLAGLSFALAINLPWYLSANAATSGKFFETFFFTQNFGRMVGKVNHQEPWWFYIPVFFGGFFPWSLVGLPTTALLGRSLKKDSGKDGVAVDLYRLSLCWFISVVVLFGVIKTKLPTYILSAVPAFAIMTALQLEILLRAKFSRRLLWTGVLSSVGILALTLLYGRLHGYIKIMIGNSFWVLPLMLALLVIYTTALFKRKGAIAIGSLCLATALGCGIFVPQGLLAYHNHKQVGFNELVVLAREAKANLAIFSAEEPSVPWMLHRPIPRIREEAEARKFMQSKDNPKYLLAPKEMLKDMAWFNADENIIAARGKWQLIKLDLAPDKRQSNEFLTD